MGIASGGTACPKPEPRKRTKNRKKREKRTRTAEIRQYVFARERDLCRCCRFRPAESMHELRARSLGGKVSRKNSVAVCGSGTTGCHGFIQSHAIAYYAEDLLGADGPVNFTPVTKPSAEWMRIHITHTVVSPPMVETEAE